MPFTSCSSLFCLCRQEQMLKNCMAAKCRHASWQKPQPFRSSVRYVLMNTNKHKFVSPGWINSLGEYGKFELIRRQKLLCPLHRNRRSFRTCFETVSTQSVNCTADKALSESVRVDTSIDSVCFGCSSQNLLSLSNSGCALQVRDTMQGHGDKRTQTVQNLVRIFFFFQYLSIFEDDGERQGDVYASRSTEKMMSFIYSSICSESQVQWQWHV